MATDSVWSEQADWRVVLRKGVMSPPSPLTPDEIARRPGAALARAFVLAKGGCIAEARLHLEEVRYVLTNRPALSPALAADLFLVDLHVRMYGDQPLASADADRLRRVDTMLPATDTIGHALVANHLSSVLLHRGEFDGAQQHAETAMQLFRAEGAAFGSLHLHTHLGQIRLMRGDLDGAAAEYRAMTEGSADLDEPSRRGLHAIAGALRAEVAYEVDDLPSARALLHDALPMLEANDAWLDVLAAAYRIRTRLAFIDAGLPGALDALGRARRVACERGMPRLDRLMRIEHVRVLTLSDELEAARQEMRDIGLQLRAPDWDDTDDWALRQGTSFVAIARWMVRARRARDAVDVLRSAEDFAVRGAQLLALAKLRSVRACAHWRLGERGDATAALLSAVRLLGRQPFRRFILDEGDVVRPVVQAALDGDHLRTPANADQRHRLAELMLAWTTTRSAGRHLDVDAPEAASPLGARRRYLELLARGLSNKEIARVAGVSVNTVKYHLKALFAELRADNRTRAVQRARELGLLD